VHEWYYLERVAELPWYYDIHCGDTDHNGLGEVYGSVMPTMHRNALLYPWIFDNFDYSFNFAIKDVGDPDGDSLMDLLIVEENGIKLIESKNYNTYPDTIVWEYPWDIYFEIHLKLGDLDGDGLGEVLFYGEPDGGGNYKVYESTGNNEYEFKTEIRFREIIGDWTGEPSLGDIDGDGLNEVFAGGIHGEIIMFECVADDSFEFVWQGYAGAPNAYSTEYLGDTDGDGLNEFMVGANGGFFLNTIWEADGDNSYQVKYTTRLYGRSWGDSDIEIGDYFGDCEDCIAICGNDYVTVIKAFGDDLWHRMLKFSTNTSSAYIRKFNPSSNLNNVIVNVVRIQPTWTTWIYNVRGFFIPGDVNSDGVLMANDVTYLVCYFKGMNNVIEEPTMRADTNGDCQVRGNDVTFLVRYLKGIGDAPEPGWCHFYVEE